MSTAALTPRVPSLLVCDDAAASLIEAGVYDLEGVRQHLMARVFPRATSLGVFLLLSCPRRGTYPCKVLVVNDHTGDDEVVHTVEIDVEFDEDNVILPLLVDLGDWEFEAQGRYAFQVWFSAPSGGNALKGELPFHVLLEE